MGFLVFALVAIVGLPVIMLLQKGLGAVSNDKQTKEDMKKGNKDIGKAWVMFAIIIVIVILFALLSSCSNQSPTEVSYSSTTSLPEVSSTHESIEFSSYDEMERAIDKFRKDRNSVDEKEWEQISNKPQHYRVNYKQSGVGYTIRVYSNMYADSKDYTWITRGLVKRYYNVLYGSYGNCNIDSLSTEDFILTSERNDKGVADKHTCHIKEGSLVEEILDFKSENVFEGVLQEAITDSGSNYLGNQDKVVNASKGYTVFINENAPLGKQLKWVYTK